MKTRWPVLLVLPLLAARAVVQAQSGSGDGYDYCINANDTNTITLTNYTGRGGAVTIPTNINGLTVTGIGDGENPVFSTSLTNVTIPGGITTIGDLAFLDCINLTNATIGNGITSIGFSAFNLCFSLSSVTIPASVTNIGLTVFANCTSLAAITVDTNNPAYLSVAGVLFDKSGTTLIQYPAGNGATSYTISNGVTTIGYEAFYACGSITNVTLPASVAGIGLLAFASCGRLRGITVEAQNTLYSSTNGVLLNKNQTTLIQYPGGLGGSYTVPPSVTIIGEDAFYYCTNLTSVTIDTNVTSIEFGGFQYCYDLTNVTLPNGLTSIAGSAFYSCIRLPSITIGNNVTSLGSFAFGNCPSLTSVYFEGNAPTPTNDTTVFSFEDIVNYDNSIVYYLPGTTSWGASFDGVPTALWVLPNPLILNQEPDFGVQTDSFGFTVSWATNRSIVVEACTNLANPVWVPLQTNALTNGSLYFSDPAWTNYAGRYYRISSP